MRRSGASFTQSRRPSITASSVATSNAEVGSSSRRIGASRKIARARPIRCLPGGELRAFLAEHRIDAGMQRPNEFAEAGAMNRFGYFRGRRIRTPVRNVVADGRGEERIFLQRDRQHAAPRRKIEAVDWLGVKQYA